MNDVYRVGCPRRHADGGDRRPLRQRVLRRAVPRRIDYRLHRARSPHQPVVAPRPQPSRRVARSGSRDRRRNAARLYERLTDGGAKSCWPMWGADGKTLFFISDRGGAREYLDTRARRAAKPAASPTSTTAACCGPRISYDGKPIVVRARLRHLDVRHRERAGAQPVPIHAARRAGRARPSSTCAHRPASRSWRSRPMARRSPSSCTARSSPPRPTMAATPRAHQHARPKSDSPGRPTAAGSFTLRPATAPASVPLQLRHRGRDAAHQRQRDDVRPAVARRQVARLRARRAGAAHPGPRAGSRSAASRTGEL